MAMRDSPNAPSQQAVLLLYQNIVVSCMSGRFATLAHSGSEAETRYYSVTPLGVTGGTGTGEYGSALPPNSSPSPSLVGRAGKIMCACPALPCAHRDARLRRARLPGIK